jgi:hypothetical protein
MNDYLLTEDQFRDEITDDLGLIVDFLQRPTRLTSTPESKRAFFEFFYVPDTRLIQRLDEYKTWVTQHDSGVKTHENAGYLMEEIAYLAFDCLHGHDRNIRAGQTEAAQHDLIVSGSSLEWMLLMQVFHLPQSGRTLLIEAKNTDDPVDDQQMSRLCFIVENKFSTQCHLGIFFSRSGATSFPEEGQAQRSLRDARATQILFHALTKDKFVIVLDHTHIVRLGERGALPQIIEALIRDIEERLGQYINFDAEWNELLTLPSHLQKHVK